MGLLKAAVGSVGGVLADQWKEFFYCDSMAPDVLMTKGQKRLSSEGRSSNTSAEDNVISDGSVIAVNNGQCILIVENGKVVDLCAEPGEYVYRTDLAPSVFTGSLGQSVREVFRQIGKRFTYGGAPGQDQRVYYFNLKELVGNKYGTPSEVPFKMRDDTTGQVLTIRIRCFGEYSYHIADPLLFYTNVAGNAGDCYKRDMLDSQLKSELLMALQPAFAGLSAQRIDYTELPGHTQEISDALNQVLSKKWRELRGLEIVSFGINSIKANEEDEEKIQKIQMAATMAGNPNLGMGAMVDATTDAMRTAAANESNGLGAAVGFMGMNMAGQTGMGMMQSMGAAQQAAPVQNGWQCPACGQQGNTGNFCSNCGKPKAAEGWTCGKCGRQGNAGNFCTNCGAPRPAPASWNCPSCGQQGNQGNFCMNCGAKKPE